ncbi:hypothetical protein F5Y14DRAFT_152618 [Nemania sp. NC0429]|nr:hypothetical protein F5Y14DRAFT_152618 [Nemania sp. NC0429]
MATPDEQRQREIERVMRNYDKKGRPLRYYSNKIGIAILKYGILYPIWYSIWGVSWVFTMLCFTGRPPFRHVGWCGTGRMQAARRRWADARVKSNVPRPLYRHKRQNHDPESRERYTYAIDEAALNRRRRLSLGPNDQGQPKTLKGLLRRAKRAVLPGRGGTKPPLERSRLLGLPAEIRALIWQYVLGNRTIHLFHGEPVKRQPYVFPLKASLFPLRVRRARRGRELVRRLSCVECVHRESPNGWENQHPWHGSCPDCGVLWDSFGEWTGKMQWKDTPNAGWGTRPPAKEMVPVAVVEREWTPLALLSTCRQIYNEAIDILYSDNIFHFSLWHDDSSNFLSRYPEPIQDFSNTILVQRSNRITRVSITAFINCQLFGGLSSVLTQHLPGLQYLELRAIMDEFEGLRALNIAALLKFAREMRNGATGVRVILRVDRESDVLSMLDMELPDGVQIIKVPDVVREWR